MIAQHHAPSPWPPAPSAVALGSGEVHIWRIWLDVPAVTSAHLLETLDGDERRSADAFQFVRDRDRYVVTRGVLRALLGRYLDWAVHTGTFCCYYPRGRPMG